MIKKIIFLLISFTFVTMNVNAEEVIDPYSLPEENYQFLDYTDSKIIDRINTKPGLSNKINELKKYADEEDMYYIINFKSSNNFEKYFIIEIIFLEKDNDKIYVQSFQNGDQINFRLGAPDLKYNKFYLYSEASSFINNTGGTDFNDNFNKIKNYIDNDKGMIWDGYFFSNYGPLNSKKTNNILDINSSNYYNDFTIPIYANVKIKLQLKSEVENVPFFYQIPDNEIIFELTPGEEFTPLFGKKDVVAKPKLQIKELKHDEFDGKYSSKTYEYSFDIFDKTKYKYFYSKDKTNWKEITENSLKIRYDMNMILYFKVTDLQGKEIATYFHEINDISHKITDDTLDHAGTGLPDYGDQSSDDPLDDESTLADIMGWFTDLFKKKLGIIFQLKEIYDSWLSYDTFYDYVCLVPDEMNGYGVTTGDLDERFQTPCDRIPQLDLSPFGIDKKVDIINFKFFMDYRDEYFFWIKLTLAGITLIKVIKNVRFALGGGHNA